MKNILSKLKLLGFLFLFSFLSPLWATENEPVLLDTIVAIVNHDVITKLELDDEVLSVTARLNEESVPLPVPSVLRKQVLERMIMSKILVQNAQESGLQAGDKVVRDTINRILKREKLNLTELKTSLEASGLSFDRFREQIKEQILISQFKKREIDAQIVVTESDISSYITKSREVGETTDEYFLGHILILVPEGATADVITDKQNKASGILKKLRSGANFYQISASSSDAQNALEGGGLGWRSANQLPEIFFEVVKSMVVGDTSKILRSANGFHILKLMDKRGNDTPVIVKQTRARHILLRLNEIRTDEEAKQKLLELRDRVVLGGIEFGDLAQQFSEDVSSSRGGDLGWLADGETVPEFQQAMSTLGMGEVSAPVKSSFGWHLIQVVERRDQDMSDERQRVEAQQAIKQKKSDQAYQEWIRVQRDRAYIKYLEEVI